MTSKVYRGVVRDGSVLLDKETPLADGTLVSVTAIADEIGTPAAVLAAMEAAPRVPTEWVDEFEQIIAQGRRPLARLDPFPEDESAQESP